MTRTARLRLVSDTLDGVLAEVRTLAATVADALAQPAPAPADPDQLLSIREVGAILSLSRTEVWRLVKAGELPSLSHGKRRLVQRSAVREWIAKRLERPEGT